MLWITKDLLTGLSATLSMSFLVIQSKIFDEENVDLNHLYIDSSKFQVNVNKYSWVWKKD